VVEGAKDVFRYCLTKERPSRNWRGRRGVQPHNTFFLWGTVSNENVLTNPVWLDDLGNEAREIALEVRRAFALDDEVAVLITVITGLSTTISHTLCD
jgi:hypothetical protein